MRYLKRTLLVAIALVAMNSPAWGQNVSGIRGFNGGVAPLFSFFGPGNYYIDTSGTQGYLYNFGNNFESFSFRNPATGQAWSGGIMTLGPQLTIGLIQGANQTGSPLVLPGPPRQLPPLPEFQSSLLEDLP